MYLYILFVFKSHDMLSVLYSSVTCFNKYAMVAIEEVQTISRLPQNTWVQEGASSSPITPSWQHPPSCSCIHRGCFHTQSKDNHYSSNLNSSTKPVKLKWNNQKTVNEEEQNSYVSSLYITKKMLKTILKVPCSLRFWDCLSLLGLLLVVVKLWSFTGRHAVQLIPMVFSIFLASFLKLEEVTALQW